jgi:hypothetical protein
MIANTTHGFVKKIFIMLKGKTFPEYSRLKPLFRLYSLSPFYKKIMLIFYRNGLCMKARRALCVIQ